MTYRILFLSSFLITAVGCRLEVDSRDPSAYNEDYQCTAHAYTGNDLIYLQWKLKKVETKLEAIELKLEEIKGILNTSTIGPHRTGAKWPPESKNTAKPNIAEKNNVK